MWTHRFWVDTETTGFSSKKHFAFQISYLMEADNRILLERTLETRPDNYESFEFSKEAEGVHGYSRTRILSLPPESEQYGLLLEDLRRYGENRWTLTGYNISFDVHFLKALFERRKPAGGKSLFYQYFDYMPCDVMQLVQAHRVAGKLNLPGIGLEKVCAYFGISTTGAHNSLIDIINTKAVFDRLMNR
jgi:DNA polymerase III epsilon subunit-like protein